MSFHLKKEKRERKKRLFAPMATSSSFSFFFILQLLTTCTFYVNGCYTSIISFGDSLADTGNLKPLANQDEQLPLYYFPPYGETFFHHPTGRCSNGRLIIDFIAEELGLPLIPPYVGLTKEKNASGDASELRQGVNFAVAGATALDSSFHEARGDHKPLTNVSLGIQLEWFRKFLPSICTTTTDCRDLIGSSLVLMGEIGGNDYNFALLAGKSIEDVEPYVPLVINTIISAINELIEVGAKTIIVPGNLPIGCSAVFLTVYYGSGKEEYDNTTGCLIRLNKFARYHNELLQRKLIQIRELHPDVNIVYADYYNAAMQFFRSPNEFGFTNGALKACCGGVGPYNCNASIECADPASTVCAQPDTYANWDGLHLTEAAYKIIYKSLFLGSYTIPRFTCHVSTLQASG